MGIEIAAPQVRYRIDCNRNVRVVEAHTLFEIDTYILVDAICVHGEVVRIECLTAAFRELIKGQTHKHHNAMQQNYTVAHHTNHQPRDVVVRV